MVSVITVYPQEYWGISWVLSGGYFFILQSLTTSKMRKKQTKKLSKFHKAKTCTTKKLMVYLVGLWAIFLNLIIQFKLELPPQNFDNEPLLWLHLGFFQKQMRTMLLHSNYDAKKVLQVSNPQLLFSIWILHNCSNFVDLRNQQE